MTDEERRIHSYLTAQAAKLPPAAIVEKVQAAMAELDTAAAAVPPARFGQRPSPDEWSASEVMAHVVSAGAHFGGGILAILEDRSPAERGQGAACEDAVGRDPLEGGPHVAGHRLASPQARERGPVEDEVLDPRFLVRPDERVKCVDR